MMTTRKKNTTSDKPQIDKFRDKARELECDDNDQRFRDRLGKLVKQGSRDKPKP